MATTHPLAPPAVDHGSSGQGHVSQGHAAQSNAAGKAGGAVAMAEQSLMPSLQSLELESLIALSGPLARLPVELEVSVPVREFRVRNLLTLEPSQLIESGWGHGDDVPLAAGPVQLAWSEFEVVDTQLAVRVTRLA